VPEFEFFSEYKDTVHKEETRCSLPFPSTRNTPAKHDLLFFSCILKKKKIMKGKEIQNPVSVENAPNPRLVTALLHLPSINI